VAWKVAVLLPMLSASIRVNDEAMKAVEEVDVQQKHQKAQHQQAMVTEPEVPPEEAAGDECSVVERAVTRNSAWRRTNKCKCPSGEMLLAEGTDCEENGRYFRASTVKNGNTTYTCGECTTKCSEIVEGAVTRNSAWRRQWSQLYCKCPNGTVVTGADEACATEHGGGRHFARKSMRNRGCACRGNSTDENEMTPAPSTASTTAPEIGEREGGNGGAPRVAGGLALATLLATLLAGSHQ